jgi:hypothetical protein
MNNKLDKLSFNEKHLLEEFIKQKQQKEHKKLLWKVDNILATVLGSITLICFTMLSGFNSYICSIAYHELPNQKLLLLLFGNMVLTCFLFALWVSWAIKLDKEKYQEETE